MSDTDEGGRKRAKVHAHSNSHNIVTLLPDPEDTPGTTIIVTHRGSSSESSSGDAAVPPSASTTKPSSDEKDGIPSRTSRQRPAIANNLLPSHKDVCGKLPGVKLMELRHEICVSFT